MQVLDSLLPACTTHHGQAQLFLQIPALQPPGAVLAAALIGRIGLTTDLWDGTPHYVLLDGGPGGCFPSCSSSCVGSCPHLNLGLLGPCWLNEVEPLSSSLLGRFVCFGDVVFLPIDFPRSPGWTMERAWWECVASPGLPAAAAWLGRSGLAPQAGAFHRAMTTGCSCWSHPGQHIFSPMCRVSNASCRFPYLLFPVLGLLSPDCS